MLSLVKVPPAIITYITNLYSSLSATVCTRQWNTDYFEISRGVFQGDTLSPLLFLLCFQPVINHAKGTPQVGYCLKIPVPKSEGLPPTDTDIYVEWKEDNSSEPPGWYHCKVIEYCSNSDAMLRYRDGAEERIDLNSVQWEFARKNGKAYIPNSPPICLCKKQREAAAMTKYTLSDSQKVKAYADDLTLISTSSGDHQLTLSSVNRCQDLGFEIRPDKCISYSFDGSKPLPRMTFKLIDGSTSNISTAPMKFLGETLAITPFQTKCLSAKRLCSKIYDMLAKINMRPIRGEYKVWMYKCYLIPSILFNLTVDRISHATAKKIQTKLNSYLKKWLSLPKCATLSTLFHPKVLNLPYLPFQLEKAKIRLLATPFISSDQNVKDLANLVKDPQFVKSADIPPLTSELISTNDSDTLAKKSTVKSLYKDLESRHIEMWNNHLESLSVQKKFKELIPLESDSHVWSRIITSLPAGQLSFLLRAGIDSLPTSATLSRWRYICDPSCILCHAPQCTVHHVLNCCPISLEQGRYTWRHDSVLAELFRILRSNIEKESIQIYADLPGLRASDSPPATIPPNIVETSARPDIVIINKNVVTLIELTIPINTNEGLKNARLRKQTKSNYIELLGDLHTRSFIADLETVEVGSLGHFTSESVNSVHSVLEHLKRRSVYDQMLSLSKISISCSRMIFNCRNQSAWSSPSFLQVI